MNRRIKIALGLGLAALLAVPALADLNYTQGDGVTRNVVLFDFTCFTTKHCSAHVPINSAGTELFTSGNPGNVNVTNTITALSLGGNSASPVADPATDPCQMIVNSSTTINLAAATATQLIPASASNKNYICSVDLFSKAGVDISVIEGTGGNCQTGTAGIIGTMSVTGISIAAQSGLAKSNGGRYVWRTNGTNTGTCIYAGSSNALTGFLKYVQAP